MTKWDRYEMDSKIKNILAKAHARDRKKGHHFDRPFLTAYQIAVEFKLEHPEEFDKFGLPLGGRRAGKHNSLAQYIAGQLSRRTKPGGSLENEIEGRFVSGCYLKSLTYEYSVTKGKKEKRIVETSLGHYWDLSMFRLRP